MGVCENCGHTAQWHEERWMGRTTCGFEDCTCQATRDEVEHQHETAAERYRRYVRN
jgi:hypothetical protein